MYNFEIDQEFENFKCFKGTYSKNNLPVKIFKERPLAFIINTARVGEPGEHWIALFINQNNIAEYFDSFGFEPICCRIKKLCELNKIDTIIINKNPLQNIFAMSCGKYCILFLKMRCNNHSIEEFLNIFSENTLKNEMIVENLI